MPRDLRDIVDYFLPGAGSAPAVPARAEERPAALPILAVPIGDRDVVRAAFAWNLAVEIARLGGGAALLAPEAGEPSSLWPEAGDGPLGAEVVRTRADDLPELWRAALDVAVDRAADTADAGVVLAHVPPTWLRGEAAEPPLLRWTLLFASPERRDLLETYGLAKRVAALSPESRIGVTIHGVQRVGDAERAFGDVARASARHLRLPVVSYGLLVDDLHVYRAIVSRRPIGIEHPQCRAARALRDVARLVLDDARKLAVA